MRAVLGFISAGILQGVVSPVFASDQRPNLELEEIVVTAQKRAESLLKVPLSVSAFTDRALEERGAIQLADFLQTSPGVSIVDSQGGNQTISIRGISASIGDSTVGYYLDEVSFTVIGNMSVTDIRTFDIERVEVLRGPQGTLYGDGSLGGVVRVLTKNPDLQDFGAKVDLTASWTDDSNDMNWAAKGAINLPIVQDKFALRIIATTEDNGGWIDNLITGEADFNTREVDTYRLKLRLAPTEKLNLVLGIWRHEENSHGDGTALDDRTSARFPAVTSADYTVYSLTGEYEMGGVTLVSASSFMEWASSQVSDFFGFPLIADNSQDVFQQELRLASNTEGRFYWTAGFYYRDIQREFNGSVIGIDLKQESDSTAWAVFGEGTWKFLDDKLNATLGLRYFEDKRSRLDEPDLLGLVTDKFTTTTPRFNLSYFLNDDWMAYANVTKGFRSGQIQPIASIAAGLELGFDVPVGIDAEALWSYEAGLKGSMFGRRLTVEAAIYRNEWKNLQIGKTIPIEGAPLGYFDNGGKARVQGVEIALMAQLLEQLTVQGAIAYNKAEFLETILDPSPNTGIVAGQRLPNVPKLTWNIASTYRWSLPAGLTGFARAGLQHNSRRYNTAADAVPSGKITTIDARVGVEGDHWRVYVFGENLADDASAVSATGLLELGHAVRLRPRTFGLNLQLDI